MKNSFRTLLTKFRLVDALAIRRQPRKLLVLGYIIMSTWIILYLYIERRTFMRPDTLFISSSIPRSKNWRASTTHNLSFEFTKNLTRSKRNAIAILIESNFDGLASKLPILDDQLDDFMQSDIIIFHSNYPFKRDVDLIQSATSRRVIFCNVDRELFSFPSNFDPYAIEPTWPKRGKWNYHQMNRFWFKLVFELPEVQQYDYVMRLDIDSQLQGTWFNVFNLMRQRNAVYFANQEGIDYEIGLPGTIRVQSFFFEYMKENNVSVKNPQRLAKAFENNDSRTYYNNFEVTKIKFFRQYRVTQWVDAVDQSHGIFLYRWGNAILRYLTLAAFAGADKVLHRTDFNLPYCHPC